MKKIISTALAGAFLATSMVAATPAFADRPRDVFIEKYYNNHPRDSEYWRWYRHRDRWSGNDYRNWYYRHHHNHDNDNAGALFLGLAAGAIAGGLVANAGNSHVQACAAAYRSYDIRTDTYLGYDGYRHECML
jgi:hypothetical protein